MPDAADDQDSAPFDELDRELRELTEGRAGEPLFLEPSAAERALAGAVRVQGAPASPAGRQARARRRRRGQRLAPPLAPITPLGAGGGHDDPAPRRAGGRAARGPRPAPPGR